MHRLMTRPCPGVSSFRVSVFWEGGANHFWMCMCPQCKARLGAIVHKKTATALALTAVKNEVGGQEQYCHD